MIKCILENGNQALLRHAAADAIIVNKDNEILLVKRASNLINGGKYAIPGGLVDRDETTKEAAKREAFEETGYKVDPYLLFRVADNPDRSGEDRQNIAFFYVAKIIEGEKTLNDEVSEIGWFPLNNLPNENEFAFDHYETIQLYIKYLKEKFELPVFGKI